MEKEYLDEREVFGMEPKTNKKNGLFLVFLVAIIIIIGLGIGAIEVWSQTAGIKRLLYILAISSTMFCLLAIIAFIPGLLGIVGLSMATGVGTSGVAGKRPPIFQVPKNHRWVLRNVWLSDPVTLMGYEEKKEGWSFYVPTLWHSDEGLVDLTPKQLDLEPFQINCIDGNDVNVDVRATYFVRTEENAAIKYLINTSGEDVVKLVKQRIRVAINQAMDVNSGEAIAWGSDAKQKYSNQASEIAGELLKNDRCETQCKDYGLGITISIENIEPTPDVKAAADRNTAEDFDKKAMKKETDAIADMVERTKANPTIVMIAQILADALRGFKKGGKKDEKK